MSLINVKKWEFINGDEDWSSSAQISPDGKLILLREYTSYEDGVMHTYRLLNIADFKTYDRCAECAKKRGI